MELLTGQTGPALTSQLPAAAGWTDALSFGLCKAQSLIGFSMESQSNFCSKKKNEVKVVDPLTEVRLGVLSSGRASV